MIVDKIENLNLYAQCLPQIKEVAEFMHGYASCPEKNQKYEIDGERLFCSVSTYAPRTVESAKYEAHRRYIDVQIVTEGEENIGWAPVSDCTVTEDFKDGGDIAFYTTGSGSLVKLKAGYFMVMFPDDAHMPCIETGECNEITKLVFKIRIKD
ncbi:MAG: DUF386 domain-containing protein [Clostridiales bacterium]|nr:DUF386 domain-containing protein [Clostridiales bacterium]